MASLRHLLLLLVASLAALVNPSGAATTAQVKAALVQARTRNPKLALAANTLLKLCKPPCLKEETLLTLVRLRCACRVVHSLPCTALCENLCTPGLPFAAP